MIELRWLEYESSVNPDTGEHFYMPSNYRKLQYRFRQPTIGEGPRDYPLQWPWSEWQDVPIVPASN